MTLVVIGLHHLPKGPLAYHFEHFVPIGQVVVGYVGVGALVVVVPAVVGAPDDPWPFLGVGPDEVDLRVVKDLMVFIGCQLVHV